MNHRQQLAEFKAFLFINAAGFGSLILLWLVGAYLPDVANRLPESIGFFTFFATPVWICAGIAALFGRPWKGALIGIVISASLLGTLVILLQGTGG